MDQPIGTAVPTGGAATAADAFAAATLAAAAAEAALAEDEAACADDAAAALADDDSAWTELGVVAGVDRGVLACDVGVAAWLVVRDGAVAAGAAPPFPACCVGANVC